MSELTLDSKGVIAACAACGQRNRQPFGRLSETRCGKCQAALAPPTTPDWAKRGYAHLFNETILQADEGCDFDFMRGEGK
jgi:hypothetical protein